MAQNIHKICVRLAVLIVSLALLVTCGVFSNLLYAAGSLSISSAASGTQATVEIAFPLVDWSGGFKLVVDFDATVLEYASASCNVSGFSFEKNASGNRVILAGSTSFDEGEIASQKTVFTVVFNIKDTTKTSTSVSCTPEYVYDYNGGDVVTGTVNTSITLKTPSSSTDGGGSGSTSSTTDDTPVSTSTTTNTTTNTTTSTKTDTNTTTTKTDTNTTTKTNSTTKTSGTVVSSTTSDTGTEPDVTDSEELTDTETNFPLSDSNSDTDVSMSETDDTDTTSDQSSSVISTVTSSTQEAPKKEISTGMIALISVGVSVVICGALTVVGLLRHKKEQE